MEYRINEGLDPVLTLWSIYYRQR